MTIYKKTPILLVALCALLPLSGYGAGPAPASKGTSIQEIWGEQIKGGDASEQDRYAKRLAKISQLDSQSGEKDSFLGAKGFRPLCYKNNQGAPVSDLGNMSGFDCGEIVKILTNKDYFPEDMDPKERKERRESLVKGVLALRPEATKDNVKTIVEATQYLLKELLTVPDADRASVVHFASECAKAAPDLMMTERETLVEIFRDMAPDLREARTLKFIKAVKGHPDRQHSSFDVLKGVQGAPPVASRSK